MLALPMEVLVEEALLGRVGRRLSLPTVGYINIAQPRQRHLRRTRATTWTASTGSSARLSFLRRQGLSTAVPSRRCYRPMPGNAPPMDARGTTTARVSGLTQSSEYHTSTILEMTARSPPSYPGGIDSQ